MTLPSIYERAFVPRRGNLLVCRDQVADSHPFPPPARRSRPADPPPTNGARGQPGLFVFRVDAGTDRLSLIGAATRDR
jgi:hypothetical protein